MKDIWNKYTDLFGKTIIHPQYFMLKYNFDAVLEVINYSRNKRVLDIGCGRMQYKNIILTKAASYFGIDHPTEHKKYLSATDPDLITYYDKISLANTSFDTVMMIEVLEYLENPDQVFSEIHRLLKKDGKFIMTSPFLYPIHGGGIDKTRYTPNQIVSMLKNNGFKKIKTITQGNTTITASTLILTELFKFINSRSLLIKLILLPPAILLTVLLNLICLPFIRINNSNAPINILTIAQK